MVFKRRTPADEAAASAVAELEAIMGAVHKSQAVIEFELDGTIIKANDNFYSAMGYTPGEVVGRKHSLFVTPEYGASEAYREFWRGLNRGEFLSDKFLRVAKGGRQIWLQTLPPDQLPSCLPPLDYMMQTMPYADILWTMFHGSADCAEVTWTLLSLSIPEWSLLAFVGFALFAVFQFLRRG